MGLKSCVTLVKEISSSSNNEYSYPRTITLWFHQSIILCRDLLIWKRNNSNKLIHPICLGRIGFDTGLMKVTVFSPCNTDETLTIVCQSGEVKVLNQGTFETFVFRGCACVPSFHKQAATAVSYTFPQNVPAFAVLHAFLYALKHTCTRYKVRAAAVVCNKSGTGANVIGMAWKKRKAETNELNFALQPQQSRRDQTESLFSRLLSRARRRYAPPSNLVSPTWLDALDVLLDLTAIKSAPINERHDNRAILVRVKWAIGPNIMVRNYCVRTFLQCKE